MAERIVKKPVKKGTLKPASIKRAVQSVIAERAVNFANQQSSSRVAYARRKAAK